MNDENNTLWEDDHNNNTYVFVADNSRKRTKNTKKTVWMTTNGVVIGYICYWYDPSLEKNNTYRLVLESIEVRPNFQGQGLAKFMINSVQNHVNEIMNTTGSFTPQGYTSLAGYLPLVDDSQGNIIEFEDMSFVKDWDRMKTFRWVK